VPAERLRAERPDHVWALDFQFDQTADGRLLKLLNVVDEPTREAPAIELPRADRRRSHGYEILVIDASPIAQADDAGGLERIHADDSAGPELPGELTNGSAWSLRDDREASLNG
jgi:hypothetical protein